MSQNYFSNIKDTMYIQARSLLGNIDAHIKRTNRFIANDDILKEVFDRKDVKQDIGRIKDYIEYYHESDSANMHMLVMIFRSGLRVGALYEVENQSQCLTGLSTSEV